MPDMPDKEKASNIGRPNQFFALSIFEAMIDKANDIMLEKQNQLKIQCNEWQSKEKKLGKEK